MRIWPFVARRLYTHYGKSVVWTSRSHRKGLGVFYNLNEFWKTKGFNTAVGIFFAIGSFLFAYAALYAFSVHPNAMDANFSNKVYFVGSVFFTLAAAGQHFQSANAQTSRSLKVIIIRKIKNEDILAGNVKFIGWDPRSAGWWSSITQFVGTIAFNISTFSAISPPPQHDLATIDVWGQNFFGSILFLASGYFAFIEVSNKYWSWMPKERSWRVVFVNFIGCVAFMIAAVTPANLSALNFLGIFEFSGSYTFIGAVAFFVGSALSIHEAWLEQS